MRPIETAANEASIYAFKHSIFEYICVNLRLFAGCSEKRDTENSEFRAKWTTDDRDAPKTVQILVCQERQSGLYTGVCV